MAGVGRSGGQSGGGVWGQVSSQDLSFPPPIPVSEPPNTARFLSSIKFSLPEAYLLGVLPSERDPKPGNLEHPEPLISRKLARKHVLLPTWDGFQGAEPQSGLALCIRGFPYHSSTAMRPTPLRPTGRGCGFRWKSPCRSAALRARALARRRRPLPAAAFSARARSEAPGCKGTTANPWSAGHTPGAEIPPEVLDLLFSPVAQSHVLESIRLILWYLLVPFPSILPHLHALFHLLSTSGDLRSFLEFDEETSLMILTNPGNSYGGRTNPTGNCTVNYWALRTIPPSIQIQRDRQVPVPSPSLCLPPHTHTHSYSHARTHHLLNSSS